MTVTVAVQAALTLALLATAYAACRPGFSGVGNVCFSIPSMTATWTDALTLCMAQNAYLADINSLGEQIMVAGLARSILPVANRIWIGASKSVPTTGTYRWINTGKLLTYSNYSPGQPSGDGNCLSVFPAYGYGWNDEACTNRNNFVCKYYDE